MRYIVKFKNVGRNKRFWESQMNALSESAIAREVKKHGQLSSRGIDIDLSDDQKTGTVFVGGFRPVGDIEIVDTQQQAVTA